MKYGARTIGLDRAISRLNAEVAKIKGATRQGLIKAALIIEAESKRNCPRQYSNLINSANTMWTGSPDPVLRLGTVDDKGRQLSQDVAESLLAGHRDYVESVRERLHGWTVAAVGHSAFYAWYVHEAGEGVKFTQGGPYFLQRAIDDNVERLVAVIVREAKAK